MKTLSQLWADRLFYGFNNMDINHLTGQVFGAAIEVYKALGPCLLESTYEQCLCVELQMRKIPFERQKELPIEYKGIKLESRYRFDILVANSLIVRHGKLPEGLGCFARSIPARHQLRFRRWQAGLAIGQKGKSLSVSLW